MRFIATTRHVMTVSYGEHQYLKDVFFAYHIQRPPRASWLPLLFGIALWVLFIRGSPEAGYFADLRGRKIRIYVVTISFSYALL